MSWTLLQNSLLVSSAATLLAAVFGVLAALGISALAPRWRNPALVLTITALALPPFLVTNCWLHFLGATGTWRTWLQFNIYSLTGAAWILALQLWPVTALAVWAAWRKLEPPLLEADPAARGWPLLRWLLLPMAGKALGFAALLTLVLALNNFAVPAILQVKVLPAEVWVQFSTNLDSLGALRVGWPLVLAPLLVLPWLARQDVPWPRRTGPASARILRRQLGIGWFTVSLLVTAMLLTLSVALPTLQLAGSTRTWTELPAAVEAGQSAAWHSFGFAAVSATVAVGVGLALAVASTPRNPRMKAPPHAGGYNLKSRLSEFLRTSDFGLRTFLSWLPFFAPGVFLGIVLIALFNRPATFWLYRGGGIVVVALVVRYFALGWNGAELALRQTDPNLTDAARLDGASRRQLLRHVLWPQIAPQIAAAWYVVYLLCLWDVESLVLILPPGGETLALRIFNLLHYGHNAQVNALCLTLLALALAPLALAAVVVGARRLFSGRDFASALPRTAAAGLLLLLVVILPAGCARQETANEAPLSSVIFEKAVVFGTRGVGVGQFNKPRSVAVDTNDNFYAADMTGRVQKFAPDGRYLMAWQLPQTDLGKPKGMARDAAGNIIVIEPHYQRVNHFAPDGRLVAQWGERGTNAGQLKMPRAAAVNSRGEIYVAEYGVVERVQRFSGRDGKFLGGFGRFGTEPGEFNRPEGVAVDAQDRVYVADSCNHRIQVFDREGKFLRTFGKPGTGRGELSYPYDVCVDAAGRVYVCEFGNSRIQVFDAAGAPLEIIGGPGAEPGRFNNPWGLALDSRGNLYVADALNNRVQKLVRRAAAATAEVRSPKPARGCLSRSNGEGGGRWTNSRPLASRLLLRLRQPRAGQCAAPPPVPTTPASDFGFRISFGLRTSDFGLFFRPRISDFCFLLSPAQSS